jgi:hypothetical protein
MDARRSHGEHGRAATQPVRSFSAIPTTGSFCHLKATRVPFVMTGSSRGDQGANTRLARGTVGYDRGGSSRRATARRRLRRHGNVSPRRSDGNHHRDHQPQVPVGCHMNSRGGGRLGQPNLRHGQQPAHAPMGELRGRKIEVSVNTNPRPAAPKARAGRNSGTCIHASRRQQPSCTPAFGDTAA